jgi:hypothetical protein
MKVSKILFGEVDVALNPIEIRPGMKCVHVGSFEKI